MLLVEPQRRRALNITLFDSQESMQAAEPFFAAMKPMDPERSGRRIDVGHYEIVLDELVAAIASS